MTVLKNHRETIILTGALLIGAVLRFLSAQDNLWFDEIWSVNFARSLRSVVDVFQIRHDNNHILNTVYLYYFGQGSWWAGYRLLSVITGTLSLLMMGYIGFKRSFANGVMALLLATFSYPLIVYSSEARGYAPAIFFVLISFGAFDHYRRKAGWGSLLIFWLASILGILAHLTFICVLAGYIGLYCFEIARSAHRKLCLQEALFLFSWPVVFIIFWYFFFVKNLQVGGGEYIPKGIGRLSEFLAPVAGCPPGSVVGMAVAVLIFVWVSFWILTAERKSSPVWFFYVLVLIVIPLIVFWAPLDFFNCRYLAVVLPFLYLMMASLLSSIAGKSRGHAIVCAAVVLLLLSANLLRVHDQIITGRGHYLEAVRYILDHSSSSKITVATDQNLRNTTVMNFYRQFIKTDKEIIYVSERPVPDGTKIYPEWFVAHHHFDPDYFPPVYGRRNGQPYHLVKIFPSANIISGWNLYLYQRNL